MVASKETAYEELGIPDMSAGLSEKGARGVGVHILSMAAYFAKDNFGLKLPQTADPAPNSYYASMPVRHAEGGGKGGKGAHYALGHHPCTIVVMPDGYIARGYTEAHVLDTIIRYDEVSWENCQEA